MPRVFAGRVPPTETPTNGLRGDVFAGDLSEDTYRLPYYLANKLPYCLSKFDLRYLCFMRGKYFDIAKNSKICRILHPREKVSMLIGQKCLGDNQEATPNQNFSAALLLHCCSSQNHFALLASKGISMVE